MRLLGLCLLFFFVSTSARTAEDPSKLQEDVFKQIRLLSLLPQQHFPTEVIRPSNDKDPSSSAARDVVLAFWRQQGLEVSAPEQLMTPSFYRVSNCITALLKLDDVEVWTQISPGGWLREGDSHKSIPLIAERLYLLGDLSHLDNIGVEFNETLAVAVRHFQRRHGLKADAVIGPKTLYWLNVTPLKRAQLLAREYVKETAFSSQLPSQYILVNVPDFQLTLVDAGQVVLQSKVVVGLPYHQTPMLQSAISSVVLNPSWHVPRSIVRRNLLRHIRENREYLKQQDFDVYDSQGQKLVLDSVDWLKETYGRFPYRLVQRPGVKNALGRFKFHFSNSFDVYLHDTPEKELFDKSERALSSGCVRVEKADALAQWIGQHLVIDQRTWLGMQDDYSTTQWFKLTRRLPVYIVYWTAWVDKQNVAQFRTDIYHKENTSTYISKTIQ